jgi:uncharacterized protein
MTSFQPLSKNHKPLFEHLSPDVKRCSDFNFVNQYIWRHVAHTEILIDGDCFIIKKEDENRFRFYLYGDVSNGIKKIEKMVLWKEKIVYLLSSQVPFINGKYSIEEDENQQEYLYLYETITGFTGQKLQKKRNHFNYFHQHNTYRVESNINVDRYKDHILPLFTNDEEREAFMEYLSCPMKPGFLLPLALRIDNEIIAFTLGNIIQDTCIIHFERARKDIRGSYQAVFYHLLEALKDKNIVWINREQDLGLEHLRKAKQSYYPDDCIRKYTIRLTE